MGDTVEGREAIYLAGKKAALQQMLGHLMHALDSERDPELTAAYILAGLEAELLAWADELGIEGEAGLHPSDILKHIRRDDPRVAVQMAGSCSDEEEF